MILRKHDSRTGHLKLHIIDTMSDALYYLRNILHEEQIASFIENEIKTSYQNKINELEEELIDANTDIDSIVVTRTELLEENKELRDENEKLKDHLWKISTIATLNSDKERK